MVMQSFGFTVENYDYVKEKEIKEELKNVKDILVEFNNSETNEEDEKCYMFVTASYDFGAEEKLLPIAKKIFNISEFNVDGDCYEII